MLQYSLALVQRMLQTAGFCDFGRLAPSVYGQVLLEIAVYDVNHKMYATRIVLSRRRILSLYSFHLCGAFVCSASSEKQKLQIELPFSDSWQMSRATVLAIQKDTTLHTATVEYSCSSEYHVSTCCAS